MQRKQLPYIIELIEMVAATRQTHKQMMSKSEQLFKGKYNLTPTLKPALYASLESPQFKKSKCSLSQDAQGQNQAEEWQTRYTVIGETKKANTNE